MSALRASCLCGSVAWEVEPPLQFMSHCHCARCRKVHGTAFATGVFAPAANLRLLCGRERIVRYESTPGNFRPFCSSCGSVVVSLEPWNGLIVMPAGSFDDDLGVRPIAHIFVASKAPWYEITGAVPQFDAYPPGVDAPAFPDLPRRAPRPGEIAGSCLCGAVEFVVTGTLVRAQHCHCARCRKARAAAHASNFFAQVDGVRFTSGEDRLASYKVPEARFFRQVFCTTCGSPMPRRDPERGFAVVPMGSLDGDPDFRPTNHIFVGSKAPWYDITDALPQFDELPPRA